MPGLRKVPQVMVKNDRDETTALFPFPMFFCLFSGSILSLSFSFFFSFFCFYFFYVTEGEKQGRGGDSVCGVIKREMVATR
jgi:sugar phosphate permease